MGLQNSFSLSQHSSLHEIFSKMMPHCVKIKVMLWWWRNTCSIRPLKSTHAALQESPFGDSYWAWFNFKCTCITGELAELRKLQYTPALRLRFVIQKHYLTEFLGHPWNELQWIHWIYFLQYMNTCRPTPRGALILQGICTNRNIKCPTLIFYDLDRTMIGKNGLYPQANRLLQHWELHVLVLTSGFVTTATESCLFLPCV